MEVHDLEARTPEPRTADYESDYIMIRNPDSLQKGAVLKTLKVKYCSFAALCQMAQYASSRGE
ncbi:hypothetical protein PAJ34TS1_02110 [Paenibacillus azoreducens]|uniref:Uncharacterized protein n=1 Tax=Paenibacillus azoreducens TaxID=116718 RepID=A0A919YIL0_9BACL|nr:hypothetical protein J34TS1_59140 [Paenibacillus azoreducens]